MTIGAECEHCLTTYRVSVRKAGRTCRCHRCCRRFLVPTPTTGVDSGLRLAGGPFDLDDFVARAAYSPADRDGLGAGPHAG